MLSTQTQPARPVILITGATDGIGLALARRYQSGNARLVLVGRRPLDELDPALFSASNYCQVDLTEVDAADRIAVWLECANIRRLDRVYLNAAVGYVGDLAQQDLGSIEQMVMVNLWAPIALMHRLAPLAAPQKGEFIFVSSITAALPTPDYATYTATKAALEGFVRSLRLELRAQGVPIGVKLVRPGATHTGLHAKSGADPMRMDWRRFPPAETTALALERAGEGRRRTTNLGMANRLVYWTGRTASDLIVRALRRRVPRTRGTPAAIDHVAITGGAAGIGAALARTFAASGCMITILDADGPAAERTAVTIRSPGSQVNVIAVDLATLVGCRRALEALSGLPPVSVFVHNAGISSVGPFLLSSLEQQQRVVALNLVAPLVLTAGVLKNQLLAPGGSFVFISSLSHFVSYPGAAVYAATKDGLASFGLSLRASAHPAIRHSLTVFPGPTRTDHAARYSPDNSQAHRRMPPEDVAAMIKQALMRRQERLVPGLGNRLTAFAGRTLPAFVERLMTNTLFAKYLAQATESSSQPRISS